MEEKNAEQNDEKLSVHGHTVIYEENSRIGIDYLYNLSYEEAQKIFSKAATDGSAVFEDKSGNGFKLTNNYGQSTYTITRKY